MADNQVLEDLEDDALRMRRVREMQRRVRESRDAEADLRTRLEEAKKRRRLAELKLGALLDAEIQPCPLFDRRSDPEPEVSAERTRATPAVAQEDVTSDVTSNPGPVEPVRPGFRLDELDLGHVLTDPEAVQALARWGAKTLGDLVDRAGARGLPIEEVLLREVCLGPDQSAMAVVQALDWLRENPPPAPPRAQRCRSCACVEAECAGCILRTGRACAWAEPDLCSACVPPCPGPAAEEGEPEDKAPAQGERSHAEWVRTVRDPADAAAELPVMHKYGKHQLEYRLAPLPDGRWAARWHFRTETSAASTPWRAHPDRRSAQANVSWEAAEFFADHAPKKKPDAAWRKIMAAVEALAVPPIEESTPAGEAAPEPADNPAPCAKCKAVAGEPCKNYKGQRKQTCPDRGKPAEQTPSAQSDLFGAQAAAASERPSLVDGRARVLVGMPADVVNLLWDEPAGLYEATVASGFDDWLDPDAEAPQPTEGRVAAAVAEVVGRPVECAGVSFSCRGVPTFGLRPLSRPATVEAPKPAAPEPTEPEPFQFAGEAPPSRADLRNAYLPGALGGRARDRYASVHPVELGLRFWVVWGITSDATNDTYGLLPLLTPREFALAYPGVVAVMEPRADGDHADLYRGLMVAVGRKHYVVGSRADGRSVTLPRKEA